MQTRIDLMKKGKRTLAPVFGMTAHLAESKVERRLLHLVDYRVSQINGCAYCLDMHSKDLRHEGETEQRIYMISAWRETDIFTPREKAALAWAEAVTTLAEGQVPDAVFETAHAEFGDEGLLDLTLAVAAINTYNRFNIAFRTPAGSYQPGQFAGAAAV